MAAAWLEDHQIFHLQLLLRDLLLCLQGLLAGLRAILQDHQLLLQLSSSEALLLAAVPLAGQMLAGTVPLKVWRNKPAAHHRLKQPLHIEELQQPQAPSTGVWQLPASWWRLGMAKQVLRLCMTLLGLNMDLHLLLRMSMPGLQELHMPLPGLGSQRKVQSCKQCLATHGQL